MTMDQPLVITVPYEDSFSQFLKVATRPYAQFFDSAGCKGKDARYSYIVSDPLHVLDRPDEAFQSMARLLQNHADAPIAGLPPFQGGLAGYLSYEMLHQLEDIPTALPNGPKAPDLMVGLYDCVLAFDHQERTCFLFSTQKDSQTARARADFFLGLFNSRADIPEWHAVQPSWRGDLTRDEFCRRVQRVIDYIHAGDIFQANLTQRFRAKLDSGFSELGFYRILRQNNPAPFSAFQNFPGLKIASSSPERFLKVLGKEVETCPIKGTRPRHSDPVLDQQARHALESSEKDRAENTMIVDLLRNDLSRVCEPHSVRVPELCKLYSFSSVHHLISTVRGSLDESLSAIDLLKACFPGGSITGAPKVRAMEIISQLEACPRGPYCGSLFWAAFNGNFDSNIVIRTAVFQDDQVSVQVGAGIVSDSEPDKEYQETMDKAHALFQAFEAGLS